MAKYNELKISCFMCEKLLSTLGIAVNTKTLSVLLRKSEINIRQHINRMSPKYYTKYADAKHTNGCLFKYRVSTVAGKRVREKLGLRYLLDQHLHLKKNPAYMNYDDFYFFDGIDDFKIEFKIDLRELIIKKIQNNTVKFEKYKNRYDTLFDAFPDTSPTQVILTNFNQYLPYTDTKIIDNLNLRKDSLIKANNETEDRITIRENEKVLNVINKMIETETAKFDCFNG